MMIFYKVKVIFEDGTKKVLDIPWTPDKSEKFFETDLNVYKNGMIIDEVRKQIDDTTKIKRLEHCGYV